MSLFASLKEDVYMANDNYWLKIAKYDLKTAEAMLKSNRYLYVGFMCNQTIEKILKCIYSDKFNQLPPRIHNLARLLKLVKLENDIPENLLEILNELNPLNIATRYPDQQLDIIKELDFYHSSKLFENTRRLFKWLETKR
jgi:HEPN domain-containing protein